jgi:hypothetical protein
MSTRYVRWQIGLSSLNLEWPKPKSDTLDIADLALREDLIAAVHRHERLCALIEERDALAAREDR